MTEANRLYQQYLEDARNLAKVGQDALTLQKAEVFAHIAAAIAATGLVTEDVFQEEGLNPIPVTSPAPTGKASLERKPEPKKVVGTTKPEDMPKPVASTTSAPVPEWLNSTEFINMKDPEKEPADKKAERMDYLLKVYGTQKMKDLPPETFGFFHFEIDTMNTMKEWLNTWKADPDRWRIKAATEISNNRTTEVNELTVEEYLTKLIPAVTHLNYLLSFGPDQSDDLMQVLGQVSKGTIKKLDDIRFRNIDFIRISVDSVIDGTFDEIAKVS